MGATIAFTYGGSHDIRCFRTLPVDCNWQFFLAVGCKIAVKQSAVASEYVFSFCWGKIYFNWKLVGVLSDDTSTHLNPMIISIKQSMITTKQMKIKDKMRFPTVNLIIDEVNNPTSMSSLRNFHGDIFFSTWLMLIILLINNEITRDWDQIEKHKDYHWIQHEKYFQNHISLISVYSYVK